MGRTWRGPGASGDTSKRANGDTKSPANERRPKLILLPPFKKKEVRSSSSLSPLLKAARLERDGVSYEASRIRLGDHMGKC